MKCVTVRVKTAYTQSSVWWSLSLAFHTFFNLCVFEVLQKIVSKYAHNLSSHLHDDRRSSSYNIPLKSERFFLSLSCKYPQNSIVILLNYSTYIYCDETHTYRFTYTPIDTTPHHTNTHHRSMPLCCHVLPTFSVIPSKIISYPDTHLHFCELYMCQSIIVEELQHYNMSGENILLCILNGRLHIITWNVLSMSSWDRLRVSILNSYCVYSMH